LRSPLTISQTVAKVWSCRFLIDLNGQTAARKAKILYHYTIVRADLPFGLQMAQTVHAAGESASPRPAPGTHAVALHARDEHELEEIAQRLFDAGIEHHCVFETDDDPKYPGQMMAIGLYPTYDKDKVKRVLSHLPLVK
jgi:peptidyl-tRNA hydrolase